MNSAATLRKVIVTSPVFAAVSYVGIVVALLLSAILTISDLLTQRAEVAASAGILEQLEGRKPAVGRGQSGDAAMPSGSPFLEGATVTIAGAALIQRVAGAVTKFGGNVLSTQVELKGTQSKAGFLSILASCEIDQVGLQQLLYDIEAGMPFLFIDQLVVQAPSTLANSWRSPGNGREPSDDQACDCDLGSGSAGVWRRRPDLRCELGPVGRWCERGFAQGRSSHCLRDLGATRSTGAAHCGPDRARARTGTGAKRQSIVGDPAQRVVRHARSPDLFSVTTPAGACGCPCRAAEADRGTEAEGTRASAAFAGRYGRER
jgi:general secretion pathway protein M